MSSCNSTKLLQEDEVLLKKVALKYEGKKVFQEELTSLSKQKGNRRLLGVFKLYLGIYNLYSNRPESKIRQNIGEEPVIFDSTLVKSSMDLMKQHLNNRGYYDSDLRSEVQVKRKKAKLKYLVKANKVYSISNHQMEVADEEVNALLNNIKYRSTLKPGLPFDLDLMNQERSRIVKTLKNHGYYNFNKQFIRFHADTNQSKKTAELKTLISKKNIPSGDTSISIGHSIYHINEVIVRINNEENLNVRQDTILLNQIKLLGVDQSILKPEVLVRSIYLKPGDIYRQKLQDLSYQNLASLRIFSFVSITFQEDPNAEKGLVSYIDLSTKKRKSFTLQSEGTNNGGNLGLNGTISFQNSNTFRGAEQLNLKLSGGLEVQQLLTDPEASEEAIIGSFLPFNTFEFGPELSLEIPRFLLPIKAEKFSQKSNPRTTFNASYNLQQRPDYKRSVSKVYINYSWNETATKTHIIQPIDLSYIKLDPSAAFQEVLRNIQNPFLRNSYTDNFILAAKYSFILNTQLVNKEKNHFYFRANVETAGNGLSLFQSSFKEDNEGFSQVAGIRYAQYIRSDIDFRFYQNFEFNKLVYRFSGGLGIPYGNSKALPFEKSFYAGGANGIRAWRARELGPGNLPESASLIVDQIGNMSILANVELRFNITKVIEGAAFVDAGNIWNLNQSDSREDTQFELNSLWRSTAIGPGLGLRLNFTFFIFRLDIATPIKEPASPNPEQFKPRWERSNLNFGIGYPF